ncbi:hypothetical protein V8G54_018454 [Vigna mungo]|uniref:Uncharacterized protein n=1 Tax=Vigna mungo TaxID=3915 RepID=A0AAQ3N9I6_VIGMU
MKTKSTSISITNRRKKMAQPSSSSLLPSKSDAEGKQKRAVEGDGAFNVGIVAGDVLGQPRRVAVTRFVNKESKRSPPPPPGTSSLSFLLQAIPLMGIKVLLGVTFTFPNVL